MKTTIENDQEYEATRSAIARLEQSRMRPSNVFAPPVAEALRGDIAEDLRVLRLEAESYDLLRSGQAKALDIPTLQDLPDAFLFARLSLGLSQGEFAQCLGLAEGQVAEYERVRYAHATMEQIVEFARRLGLLTSHRIVVPLTSNPGGTDK